MPKEFCEFESYYKQWIRWMANKTVCNGPFDVNAFLQVLTRDAETQDFQQQVNELFDWKTSCDDSGPVITVAAVKAAHVEAVPIVTTEAPATVIDTIGKARVVNGRLNARKKSIQELAANIKDKQISGMLTTFSAVASPSFTQYQQVIDKILLNWPTGKKKTLNKKQATSLVSLLTGNYLDKYTFGGGDLSAITAIKPVLEQVKTKMALADIYKEWNAATVKKYEPSLDLNQIENLFK